MSRHRRAILFASLAPCLLILIVWIQWLDVGNDARLFGFGRPPRWYVTVSIPYRALEVSWMTNPFVGQGGVVEEGSQSRHPKRWQPVGGFYVGPVTGGAVGWPQTIFVVLLPFWLLLLISAALPAAVVWQPIRARRRLERLRRNRVCTVCGYDLRASPNRCPECGATAAAAPN